MRGRDSESHSEHNGVNLLGTVETVMQITRCTGDSVLGCRPTDSRRLVDAPIRPRWQRRSLCQADSIHIFHASSSVAFSFRRSLPSQRGAVSHDPFCQWSGSSA
jgi:hypothetical protein